MPTPFQSNSMIESAIDSALKKAGAIPASEEFVDALENEGLTVQRLASELANLIFNSKDITKYKAIVSALKAKGINIDAERVEDRQINVQFNIQGDNTNLNNVFAPERK